MIGKKVLFCPSKSFKVFCDLWQTVEMFQICNKEVHMMFSYLVLIKVCFNTCIDFWQFFQIMIMFKFNFRLVNCQKIKKQALHKRLAYLIGYCIFVKCCLHVIYRESRTHRRSQTIHQDCHRKLAAKSRLRFHFLRKKRSWGQYWTRKDNRHPAYKYVYKL